MVKKENSKKANKKLNKAEYKMTHSDEEKKPKVASLILLAIMLSSIIGFVAISPGSNSSGEDDAYSNLPFGEYPTQTGTVWAAVINQEQFLFSEVDSFLEKGYLADIANEIKQSNTLNVYLDEGFENLDGAFLLEQKVSRAFEKSVSRIENLTCSTPTVVFTYNASQVTRENCLIVESIEGEEAQDTQALAYYLVNDFQG